MRHSVHPYQAPVASHVAPPVRQRNVQESSASVESPECLPAVIFRFLNLSEINIALREEEPKLYIIMFSNPSLPYIVSVMHWARLGELELMYWIKTAIARYQCNIRSTVRTPWTLGSPVITFNPNSSFMKIAWNCQGAGSVVFGNHAHELVTTFCTLTLG